MRCVAPISERLAKGLENKVGGGLVLIWYDDTGTEMSRLSTSAAGVGRVALLRIAAVACRSYARMGMHWNCPKLEELVAAELALGS